ncbi:ndufs4 NADH dehydrogenase Fe-S protein subunit [Cystobasidiomycetes sp. EMM_F5]
MMHIRATLRLAAARRPTVLVGRQCNFSSSPSSSSSDAENARQVLVSEARAEADGALTRPRADGEAIAAAVVSGAPPQLHRRPVRIYRPAGDNTQSANRADKDWVIDWDTLSSGGRWENGLMGWASSADYMQGTNLKFKTKEDAINFAEKQGYPYFVQE